MVASCLVKDPTKRPSAKKLLRHSVFRKARSIDYISRTLLEDLPTLGDRIKELKVSIMFLRQWWYQYFMQFLPFVNQWYKIYLILLTEKGRRYACTREDAWWTKGGNITSKFHYFLSIEQKGKKRKKFSLLQQELMASYAH